MMNPIDVTSTKALIDYRIERLTGKARIQTVALRSHQTGADAEQSRIIEWTISRWLSRARSPSATA